MNIEDFLLAKRKYLQLQSIFQINYLKLTTLEERLQYTIQAFQLFTLC